jgi:formylmethanofuran dehydrogenase subunit B
VTEITEVPSPFCGIGTDDLKVQVDGLNIKVTENGCLVNTPSFEFPISDTQPRIDGQEVSLEQAVAKAAQILKNALQPVIGACATDVNGMRALLSLADRSCAVIDQMNFSAAKRNILAMQDSGLMLTTLAEVKNRCDLMLVIGCDPDTFAPRFFDKYLFNETSMFLAAEQRPDVIYLGRTPAESRSAFRCLPCEDQDLPEILAVLRALIKKHPVQATEVAGIQIPDLQALADRLSNANYGVVTWAGGELAFSQAELTVQMICELIKDLNRQNTRCSGLFLGGKEGDQTANQVCAWQIGYPARVSFNRGYPEYDPYLYDSNLMFANGEVDGFLWVQAFNAGAVPPTGGQIPTVVIARSGMTFSEEPDVYIPVGTPGIDHAGHAYRMDNVVAIRLKKLRDSGLPTTAEVLTAIEQAMVN